MILILCRRCYIICLIIWLKVNGVIIYHLNPIAIIIIIIRPFVINCIYIHFTIYSTVNMALLHPIKGIKPNKNCIFLIVYRFFICKDRLIKGIGANV